MESTHKFCCKNFFLSLTEAGIKGFSIIPCIISDRDDYRFIIQFRTVDSKYYPENESRVIVGEMGIKYCPWCGTELSEVVKFNKEEITFLAKKNEHLITKI